MTISGPPAGMPVDVHVEHHPGVGVVRISGDFDMHAYGQVKQVVIDPEQCYEPEIVLDLTSVSFLDSAGISTIVACRRHLTRRSARLSLVVSDGAVGRVLASTGIGEMVQMFDSVSAALKALASDADPH